MDNNNFSTTESSAPKEFVIIQNELDEVGALIEILKRYYAFNVSHRVDNTGFQQISACIPILVKKLFRIIRMWEQIRWSEFDASLFNQDVKMTFESTVNHAITFAGMMARGHLSQDGEQQGAWGLAQMLADELRAKFGRVVCACKQ